ncbi:FMN reductase [Adhaeribacter arboris]|uniref:FMN reductase n=1 Tax=Adhaeribacter arboris TaxID=2072846 RepID=A0A2T2YCE8_9BACT|nr:NAD(P)H-dependent oxidoreductase [Adhaeribacter arboris]PSR53201.1 FMN reductase [Adhaeribacter arboris]
MQKEEKKILIINGSIRGKQGNSGALSIAAEQYLHSKLFATASIITLAEPMPGIQQVYDLLTSSHGFLIITGTYWNNYGSSLQRFIEIISAFENSPALFGKPVACAVSMDSVGGADVASRIQSVFSGLGCWSPPCSTLVVSRVGQEAISASKGQVDDPNEDVWRVEDLEIVLKNLVKATSLPPDVWVSWPHVTLKIPDGEWPATGNLDLNSPRFL